MTTKSTTYDARKPARGWTPARRAAQAARIRLAKPWLKSTGPKTAAGKARVRLNAYKHGLRSAPYAAQLARTRALLRIAALKTHAFKAQVMTRLPVAYWHAPTFSTPPLSTPPMNLKMTC